MEHTQHTAEHHDHPHHHPKPKTNKNIYIVPAAIIIAGALIAWGLFAQKNTNTMKGQDLINGALTEPEIEVAPVTNLDHIQGDKDAKIVLIEYSDLECPYCKVYHETVKKLFTEYEKTNQVAWVYRHFPLSYGETALHKYAAKEAESTECVYELGGNTAFWKYTDSIYATTKSNDGLDLSTMPALAEAAGVDKVKFQACIDSGKYATKIKEAYDAGLKAGAEGTPYTVIRYKGQFIPLVDEQGRGLGALPYDVFKKIIDRMLAQ
jgi:protein-disulfide isomerase